MFRAVITKSLRQSSATHQHQRLNNINETSATALINLPVGLQHRYSSTYLKSKVEEAPEKYTAFEKSYAEWKYVEKLIPPVFVPEAPTDPSVEFPSRWKPANPPPDRGYLVQRTKNHMVPVYLDISYRGLRRMVKIRNVVGNIFKLEQDIANYLQPFFKNPVITYVNEPCRTVHIKGGDKYELTKKWIISQGF